MLGSVDLRRMDLLVSCVVVSESLETLKPPSRGEAFRFWTFLAFFGPLNQTHVKLYRLRVAQAEGAGNVTDRVASSMGAVQAEQCGW